MTEPREKSVRRRLSPVLIVVAVVAVILLVLGFLSGSLGQKLVGDIGIPDWLKIPSPEPHLAAPVLFHIWGLPVTNTILAAWITVIFLVVVSWLITRKMKLIPGRVQAVFEFILGWIYDFCKSVAGEENGRKFFPMICTIFLLVAFNAWLSLVPGFASIEVSVGGHHYELLRGANTDINTPLAIAFISFVFVAYWGLKTLKFGWLKQYFNFGPFFRSIGNIFRGKFNLLNLFSGIVDAFIGILEFLSMLIRIVSFTFRLFGNMTAGEILIMVAAFLLPMAISWAVYGLEVFIGFIQALVFSGLTLAFASMAVSSHEAEEH